jgi:hypothetical protein
VGLRDTLFGRTKQAAPNLDNLFALPTAALTLQSELDLVSSGEAGLCFKAGSGETTLTTDDDIKQLLNFDQADIDKVSITTDDLGFKWLVVKDPDLGSLVTRIHSADTSMVEHGLGPRLLCAVFGFVPKTPPGESLRLVYLMKQGTFYPFAPTGPSQRDNELELRVKSFLSTDLPIEKDLSRWMALWNLPVN